jgi:Holliday junction DNA helicase RuvA
MIAALIGTIEKQDSNPIVFFAGPVGYAVNVPPSYLGTLPTEEMTFRIHTTVKEDAIDLYGFHTKEELKLFELLLTVSGIGPKTALLVMDKGVTSITNAIKSSDVALFTTVPRLGLKNAQKIIIELRSKVGADGNLIPTDTPKSDDVRDALMAMGFSRKEVETAMEHVDATLPVEQAVKMALKKLA